MKIKEKDKELLEVILSITKRYSNKAASYSGYKIACPSSVCTSRYVNVSTKTLICSIFLEYMVHYKANELRSYVSSLSESSYSVFSTIHTFIHSQGYLDYIFENKEVSEEFKSLDLGIEVACLLLENALASSKCRNLPKKEILSLCKDLVYYTGDYEIMKKLNNYGGMSSVLTDILITQNLDKTVEFLTQKYKKEELLMNSETFQFLKSCLIDTASSTSKWQLESDRHNSSTSRELCLYVLKNFDYLTEGITDKELASKNCEYLLDLAKILCVDVESKRFQKIKDVKSAVGTHSVISSWGSLTEANLNYIKSVPLISNDPDEPFNWSVFKSETKDRIASGRVWYWNGLTDAICILSQIDFKEYEKYIGELLKTSNKHNVRAIKAYTDCYNGICDFKQARKYRSEAQNVSLHAVRGMLRSKDKYDDLTLRKNISQFADSKHQDVINFLVKTVPPSYLSLFLANPLASKSTIQSRMKVGK